MAIANVTLNNTFDEWRTTTNQLIGVYDETNTLAVASFNKANSVTQDAANTTANILISNTTEAWQRLEISGDLMLASSAGIERLGESFLVPPHTTCWISARQ